MTFNTHKNMKRILLAIALLCAVGMMAGCVSSYTSTIVGGDYDAKKNTTDYFVLPFGQVSIPGKWEKWAYNPSARQQFFINEDSVIVAVVFGRTDKYEFNKDGTPKGLDFLMAFYEWEADYFKSHGYETQFIETDTAKQYIIYRFYSETANTYFLIGVKCNGNISNFSVNRTDKWTEEEKLLFLKNLYNN